MITVQEAKKIVLETISSNPTEIIQLNDAMDLFLSEDIIAPLPIPLFNQSAMDGYAFRFEDKNQPLKVVDEIPAGDTRNITIKTGEAVRIFTGSKVPDSCDTVVMQELTATEGNQLLIQDKKLKLGGNVRTQGNQLKKGDLALQKGTKIDAGTIGFLTGMGIQQVKVNTLPKVTIIATGNELVQPGKTLQQGQIYESNTYMLQAALKKLNINPTITTLKDSEDDTIKAIGLALKNSDLLLISGGISVGDYDFVKTALEKNEVSEHFYKVKQKPGKPLYYGQTKNTIVFALPGNPAAALNCFYEYVNTAIQIMLGNNQPELPKLRLPLTKSYTKKAGRANFLKGITDFKGVTALEGQGSDALQAFALANCLIYTNEEDTLIPEGETVEVHLLPL